MEKQERFNTKTTEISEKKKIDKKKILGIIGTLLAIVIVGYLVYMAVTKAPQEAVLSIISTQGRAGQTVNIGIDFKNARSAEGATQAAAMNFDLIYDQNILAEPQVTGTELLEKAGKAPAFNLPQEGLLKILVGGINRNEIEDGRILNISFKIKPDTQPGETPLSIEKITVVDPDAQLINILVKNGLIKIIQ